MNKVAEAKRQIAIVKAKRLSDLDLRRFGLIEIPIEVFELEWIESLVLGGENAFSSDDNSEKSLLYTPIYNLRVVPPEIGKLKNLKKLNLSYNNYIFELPDSISDLTNLEILNLRSTNLRKLPEISHLKKLRSLDLSDTNLDHFPKTINFLENLQDLNLRYTNLGSLPYEIGQLKKLKNLDLFSSNLNEIPATIGQLENLRSLDLRSNHLTVLPKELWQLKNLVNLDLSENNLRNLSSDIGQLLNLEKFQLRFTALERIPHEVSQLENLRSLDLRSNHLTTLPNSVGDLKSLQSLDLRSNNLNSLPKDIGRLGNLEGLDLCSNNLKEIPATIGQLENLRSLDLRSNHLTALPKDFWKLKNLKDLDLSDNNLREIHIAIGELRNLEGLDLCSNNLKEIPATIGQLENLRSLNLANLNSKEKQNQNRIRSLPSTILKLKNLRNLGLDLDVIETPPPEVVSSGIEAIFSFFEQLEIQGQDEIYEAKLLLVGEGYSGKTTFAKKIVDPNYRLREEDPTRGIEVFKWEFPVGNGKTFRVNIWDFGGQEIYHATHQFFLTKRSLYVLLADNRQGNTDFYYWLNVIEALSDSSPTLIVKNKKTKQKFNLNETQIKSRFRDLKEVLQTDLNNNEGLNLILEELKYRLKQLPHVGKPLPATWVEVRRTLEADLRNYIGQEEFFTICETNKFTSREKKQELSEYLHDLGVILHFQKDPILKHYVILKPEWGTAAVYKVLDNKSVNENMGRFSKTDLKNIWYEDVYCDMQDELLQLMMRFKLCYEIPQQPGHYIAPQLLSIDQPPYDWDGFDNLQLRYNY